MFNQKKDIKDIADIIGEWGKWQFLLALYVFLLCAAGAFVNMGYFFHAKTMDFWCSDVPIDYQITNITKEFQCIQYSNPNQSCNEWTYNTKEFKNSIINEFNLVCHRSSLASLSQSIFMLGYVFSGLIVSHYSDKYGRRPMIWLCYTIEVLAIISCGLSYNIYQYIFSRFLVGLGHSGGGWAIYVILIESCGPKHRADIVLLSAIGWVVGYVILPGFAYYLPDFRYMQLFSAIPMALMLIWFYYFEESVRWLIAKGKLDKAEVVLKKALKTNGKTDINLKDELKQLNQHIQREQDLNAKKESHNMLDLVKTPHLRRLTLILWYIWIINALMYYGFSFNMSDFGGNFYITFLLSGVVELPSTLVTPFLMKFYGRRNLFVFFNIALALSCFAVIPFDSAWIKVFFALMGKLFVSCAWAVNSIHMSEVYPTVLRNTGLGIASVVGRIGAMSAPFMGNLVNATSLAFVMAFYGTIALIGAVLYLFLPETKDKEIPDTIEEAENMFSK